MGWDGPDINEGNTYAWSRDDAAFGICGQCRERGDGGWILEALVAPRYYSNMLLFGAQQIQILAVLSQGFVDLRALDVE